jgi:hypothetical protein
MVETNNRSLSDMASVINSQNSLSTFPVHLEQSFTAPVDRSIISGMGDTFMQEVELKYPESSIKINCTPHNAPAVFFSR